MMKQSVQDGSYRPCLSRKIIVILELPEDLRFANHHRIKTRRNTKQMADRVATFVRVNVLFEPSGYAVSFVIAQEALDIGASGLTIGCRCHDFHAITRGKNDALLNG